MSETEQDDEIRQRLQHWRPTMKNYHAHESVSCGFLGGAMRQGLSTSWHRASQPFQDLTDDPQLARGAALHAWLSKDYGTGVSRADPKIKTRRGAAWDVERVKAIAKGASVLLKFEDWEKCFASWHSLLAEPGFEDTPAKSEIRAIYKRWEGFPEVSHLWKPTEVPGCLCRIRQDIIAKPPGGDWWGAFSIKTTTKSLTDSSWWPFWRRYYMRSEAFYRAGLNDLFWEVPFKQFLIIARLEPPYPWRIVDLSDWAEEMDDVWYSQLVPQLADITERLARGDHYGPEEGGLFP
jgi:hypothetical protein